MPKRVANFRGICYNFPMQRVVAFDIGDKRIGVAVTDPFGEYAMPSDTYFRTGNFREDVDRVAAIAREKCAEQVVCGLPLNGSGEEGEQVKKTRRFVEALQSALSVPVIFVDERFTTAAAREDLNFLGVSAKRDKKKKHVDSLAAAYILENYLADCKKRSLYMKENRHEEIPDGEENIVELVDEDGTHYFYEHLMTFGYQGEDYVALTPASDAETESDEDEEAEVAIFHIVGDEDNESLEPIEDEALLEEVFEEFTALYEEEDEDDEEGGEA